MKNYVQKGDVFTYTIPAETEILPGAVVISGKLIGIAVTGSSTGGEEIECDLRGVFNLAKEAPLVITQGDRVFWDTTNEEVTKTVTDVFLGVAFASAASADTEVDVLLTEPAAETTQGAAVADISTANGSDAATTQALANATKTKVNELLDALRDAGIIAT